MNTVFRFYDYNGASNYRYTATYQVNWSYSKTGKSITINSITYNMDDNVNGWYVGSAMKLGIRWSDGAETIIANGTYNYPYRNQTRGAGFVTKGSVLGVFSDGNNNTPVTHTFSGLSGGFTMYFGSTAGTLNYGNPNPYQESTKVSGDDTWNIGFASGPSLNANRITTGNPGLYELTSSISGINWGEGYSSKRLRANVTYTIDGQTVSYNAYDNSNPGTSGSFSIDSSSETSPWLKVPDGETVTISWTASTNIGSSVGQKTQFCMLQYDAYVIEDGVNNGNPVEADLFVNNAIGQQPNKQIRRVETI